MIDAYEMIKNDALLLRNIDVEYFLKYYLNGNKVVLKTMHTINKNKKVNTIPVGAEKELESAALMDNVKLIVEAHNHPGVNNDISFQDKASFCVSETRYNIRGLGLMTLVYESGEIYFYDKSNSDKINTKEEFDYCLNNIKVACEKPEVGSNFRDDITCTMIIDHLSKDKEELISKISILIGTFETWDITPTSMNAKKYREYFLKLNIIKNIINSWNIGCKYFTIDNTDKEIKDKLLTLK